MQIIGVIVAMILGIIGGNGAVYAFNHIPAQWLCDYGEVPKEDKLQRQRINSRPWKALFSVLMVAGGVKLAADDFLFAMPVMAAMWLLIIISIADAKYMIIPDQAVIALAVCSVGFVNYHSNPLDMLYGVLCGGGVMLLMALLGRLISGKEAMGFGDVKLMAALGFITGLKGIITVIIGMSVISAMAFYGAYRNEKNQKNRQQTTGPVHKRRGGNIYACNMADINRIIIEDLYCPVVIQLSINFLG